MAGQKRHILHADLDAFFVSVERILNPTLRGKPVIVGGAPDKRGVVAACSYETRVCGIRSAMPLRTAQRLCPDAVFLPVNGEAYRMYSHRVALMLRDTAPVVEQASIDEFYLDLSGCEDLFGGIAAWCQRLRDRVLDELALPMSMGLASSKLVAKMATDYVKEHGDRSRVFSVPHGAEAAFLAPLPVDKLPGIGPQTGSKLRAAGINTLSDLQTAPDAALTRITGAYGTHLKRKSLGKDMSLVRPRRAAKSIGHERTFLEDSEDVQKILATLRLLAEKTGYDLRRKNLCATRVMLKIRYDDFETCSSSRRVPATSDDRLIYQTAKTALTALTRNRKPVRLVGVRATGLLPILWQGDLYDDTLERRRKLLKAVDKLRDRFGFGSIGPPSAR